MNVVENCEYFDNFLFKMLARLCLLIFFIVYATVQLLSF